jgi:parallel beta-helix repeat protein
MLSSEYMYRDSSIAIKEMPARASTKKKTAQKPPKPRSYGITILHRKGYVVEAGETARLSGEIVFPENSTIHVKQGGELIINSASLSPQIGAWGGISFHKGSKGSISDTLLSGAVVGIRVSGSRRTVSLKNLEISGCEEYGIHIENSEIELSELLMQKNKTGIYVEKSRVTVRSSRFENNERGILYNHDILMVENCLFNRNSSYGIRVYGRSVIGSSVFKSNHAGVVVEKGTGNVLIKDSTVEINEVDGIVVSTSNAEIRNNIIAGNGRHGIYIRDGANPTVLENDIINNRQFAVVGGGRIDNCFIAYNNGSIYIDDTERRGMADNVLSSSSTSVIKQLFNVDFIESLSYSSVVQ